VHLGPVDADVDGGVGRIAVGVEPFAGRLLLEVLGAVGEAGVAEEPVVAEDVPDGAAVGDCDECRRRLR
jgi:hypothetical protein